MIFSVEGPLMGKEPVCIPILRSLSEWFGIEESIINYSAEIDNLPTFLAKDSEQVVGFLSLKVHNPYSAEIYVMGILPEVHRQGIGRALIHQAEEWLMKQGIEYLQVKTLGPSDSDPNYAKSRAFYMKMGFRPLEELNQIWDEHNPCLILVKRI
ncbi:MAG: GNAT family N-acetyltransferase [Anaerolineales bacterium]